MWPSVLVLLRAESGLAGSESIAQHRHQYHESRCDDLMVYVRGDGYLRATARVTAAQPPPPPEEKNRGCSLTRKHWMTSAE